MNIMEYNTMKKMKLMENIFNSDGNYHLVCIDVDDVIFEVEPIVQEILAEIDYRSTKKYREKINKIIPEDTTEELQKSFKILKSIDILNAILEETRYVEIDNEKERTIIHDYKQIDYDKIYQDKYLIKGAYECIKYLLENRPENYYYIFLSHKNPEREGIVKTKKLYELFPEIDAIETLPFHAEIGSKIVNSKALWIKQVYGLENLSKCILIDDNKTNCDDFKKHGGLYIRYLPDGLNESHTLADHISKVVNLDPHMLQFAISYIEYTRRYPEYISQVDVKMPKVKKL